jgi:hypothetical protein
VNYLSEYPLDDNSGFRVVKKRGVPFICDNIPKRVATGEYENERIDAALARVYWHNRRQEPDTVLEEGFQWDEAWIKCWKVPEDEHGLAKEVDRVSCYKSTVIIPMTLWNNQLDSAFLRKMSIKAKANEEVSRTIFGYLCFDHVKENYFNDDIDIDVGYIFADIISLYMIARLIYTELSDTFRTARKLRSES